MILPHSPKAFLQRMIACVQDCTAIAQAERLDPVPAQKIKEGTWIIGRGTRYFKVTEDARGQEPFSLTPQGRLSIYVRLLTRRDRKSRQENVEITDYSLAFTDLSQGDAGIASLRYDFDPRFAHPNSDDWDEELKDNVAHPLFHLHVNFHVSDQADDVRLPLGMVSPILVLRNFSFWYVKG